MLAYDIFTDDAFSVAEMREMVDDLSYIPSELNSMGLFTPDPIRTTTVQIARSKETLSLVPLTERGSARTRLERDSKKLVTIPTFALRQEDRVNHQALQNIVTEGMLYGTALAGAMEEVEKRNRKMMRKLELTREFHRMAAINGYVLDADGSIVMDIYENFGLTRPVAIVINPALVGGNLRKAIYQSVIRPLADILIASGRNPPSGITALCGDNFYDALITSAEIRETYLQTSQAADLREGFKPYESFTYAGVTWMNYRGTMGTTITVPTNECIFLPRGVEDMFAEFRAPGEDFRYINKPGEEFYAVVSPDNRVNRFEWVDLTLDAYPAFVALVPEGLLRGVLI